jgi:hypothetical protein
MLLILNYRKWSYQKLKKAKHIRKCNTNGTYVPEHFHVTEVGLITKTSLTVEEREWNRDKLPIMGC